MRGSQLVDAVNIRVVRSGSHPVLKDLKVHKACQFLPALLKLVPQLRVMNFVNTLEDLNQRFCNCSESRKKVT